MAERRAKGSIILEILIALLIVILIATIYIPKTVWDDEERLKQECRSKMDAITIAQIHYKMRTDAYSETLSVVFNYLEQDSFINAKHDSLFGMPFDSMLTDPQTGLDYVIKVRSDSTPFLQIICPNEKSEVPYMYFYKKSISNHGLIKDGEKTWE